MTADSPGDSTPGFFLFENLTPGDYFVVFDLTTFPAGFVCTLQDAAGSNESNDSDADPATGVAVVTSLSAGENDLTWGVGMVEVINPAIEIVKYVDKIVSTSTMTTIDFDTLSAGDIVASQFASILVD